MDAPEPQDSPGQFDDLESQLRRLSPAPPSAAVERRLGRELDALTENRRQNRVIWMRFAPLAAAACVVLTGAWILQGHLGRQAMEQARAEANSSATAAESLVENSEPSSPAPVPASRKFVSPPALPSSGVSSDRLVPVSSQQYLRQASQGGVVELSGQTPARELKLEYDDAWHWHDPETGTNVRVFRPREEVLLVPIETD